MPSRRGLGGTQRGDSEPGARVLRERRAHARNHRRAAARRDLLVRQEDQALVQVCAREDWHYYEELVEILSQLANELFVVVILEEAIEIAWNTGPRRNAGRLPMGLEVPDCSADFHQA